MSNSWIFFFNTVKSLLQEISTQAYYSPFIVTSCYWSLLLSKFQQFVCDSVTPALTSCTLVPYFQTSTKQNTTNSWKCTQNQSYYFPYNQRQRSSVTTLRNLHYYFRSFFTSQSWSITLVISPLKLSVRITVSSLLHCHLPKSGLPASSAKMHTKVDLEACLVSALSIVHAAAENIFSNYLPTQKYALPLN